MEESTYTSSAGLNGYSVRRLERYFHYNASWGVDSDELDKKIE